MSREWTENGSRMNRDWIDEDDESAKVQKVQREKNIETNKKQNEYECSRKRF